MNTFTFRFQWNMKQRSMVNSYTMFTIGGVYLHLLSPSTNLTWSKTNNESRIMGGLMKLPVVRVDEHSFKTTQNQKLLSGRMINSFSHSFSPQQEVLINHNSHFVKAFLLSWYGQQSDQMNRREIGWRQQHNYYFESIRPLYF